MSSRSFCIVGANLTGGRAAEALRESGFDGRIVLVGAEPDRPYERPPLSKEYLRGEMPEEKVYLRPPSYYEEQRIDLRLGVSATRLDATERTVELASAERVNYEKLLIATGCEVRRLDIPGTDLGGVRYLRTRAESAELAVLLHKARRVVVVGAGFIGSEVAASARLLGKEVTVLEASAVPLTRALGTKMGEVCAAIHRDHGVDLRLSCHVREFRGAGRIEEVVLADGSRVQCDLAIVGVGVAPSVGWLKGSGVALDNGVLVNEYCETNLSGVYAAGDVANAWNPLFDERIRVEHFDNAQNHGIAAGKVMAGAREPYAPIPYFWSDQYEHTMQYVGHASGEDEIVLRGDLLKRSFTAFYVREGRVRAGFAIGRPRDIMATRRLIQAGKQVDPKVLADEQTDLRALASKGEL
jgi:3-phenylpropionate/trans-cinnamate dioxygenase ferredoxin reductase subunit